MGRVLLEKALLMVNERHAGAELRPAQSLATWGAGLLPLASGLGEMGSGVTVIVWELSGIYDFLWFIEN